MSSGVSSGQLGATAIHEKRVANTRTPLGVPACHPLTPFSNCSFHDRRPVRPACPQIITMNHLKIP